MGHGHARREQHHLRVAAPAVLLDADGVEQDPRQDRQEHAAAPSGTLIGNCSPGITPSTFPTKMKKNRVVRYGTKRSPCSPMTSSTIPTRTKSTTTSMKFCRPVGTIFGLRNASRNRTTTTIGVKNVSPHGPVDAAVRPADVPVRGDARPDEVLGRRGLEPRPRQQDGGSHQDPLPFEEPATGPAAGSPCRAYQQHRLVGEQQEPRGRHRQPEGQRREPRRHGQREHQPDDDRRGGR